MFHLEVPFRAGSEEFILWTRIALGVIWLRFPLMHLKRGLYDRYDVILSDFISTNPLRFYVHVVRRFAIPNSRVLALVLLSAEIAIGLCFVSGAWLGWAAPVAIALNVNFCLVAGWANPAIGPLNFLMIVCQTLILSSV